METGEDVLAHEQSATGFEVGTDDETERSLLNRSESCCSPCSPKNTPTTPIKRERKVSFPDDSALVRSVEPFDPWKDAGNCTSKEVIDAYRRICTQLKAKPCDKLIKQLEVGTCRHILYYNKILLFLVTEGTKLDLKSCETLEEVLRRVRTKTLDLENTSLEDETPCLEYLDVRHTVWTEQSIPLLGRSLRLNCPLTILHMEATNLSGRSLFLLSNAVKANQILRDLFVGDNKLVPSDGQCIGAMLKTNTTLRLLDLRNNSLQDLGLGHICEGLSEQTEDGLQTLVLWNNQLTYQGMGYLSRALVSLKNLQTLNLGHNRLTNEGIHSLKDGLLINKSLQRLGLLNTRLSSEGVIALAEVIADSKVMLRLDIRENDPYVGGLMALSLALKMNSSLVRIDLDKELKKEPGMETTQRCLLADIYSYCQRNKNTAEKKEGKTPQVTQNVKSNVTPSTSQTGSGNNTHDLSPNQAASTSNDDSVDLIQIEPAPPQKSKFELRNFGGFTFPSSRFRITRIFESSHSRESPRSTKSKQQDNSSGEGSTSSEGEGLLVEIDPEPMSEDISKELEEFDLDVFESDSSSSQDTDWESRVENYACGSRESVDSMGTPIARSGRLSGEEMDGKLGSNYCW
ncbi:hypothetical protein QZH41_013429 [Actinostola sp. cb2023]|nr:hypothetical protein QZH41_013429 [Actinostola sp. cb2023]